MSTEDNKEVVRRVSEEVFNQGNVATIDELFAPNYLEHLWLPTNVPLPAQWQPSLAQFKQHVSHWRTTFPDLQYTIELQVAEEDLVVTRLNARGTHTGEYQGLTYQGIPPTGKQVTWTETWMSRIADGKIVEGWNNGDDVGRLQQIGALPPPGQGSSSPLSSI